MKKLLLTMLFLPTMSFATDYTHCHNGKSYKDTSRRVADPNNQWICELPTDDSGKRCPQAQQRACQGGSAPGPHDVPNGGEYWFYAISTMTSADVRCTCGCFAEDTLILTENGELPIWELLDAAKYQDVRVAKRESLIDWAEFGFSQPMRASDFTKGPEENPMIVLTVENGSVIKLTDNHPVLVVRGQKAKMIRADEVVLSDAMIDDAGNKVAVTSIDLEMEEKEVINFSSSDKSPLSHVVVANSLQVGDHKWQVFLDIMKSREDVRQNGGMEYLNEIAE